MIRKAILISATSLSACAEPPPPAVGGQIVRHAVELAQARVEHPRLTVGSTAADQAESGE
jgi:hypothetical protein